VHVIARRGRAAPGVTLHPLRVPSFWQPLRVSSFARLAGREIRAGDYDVVHSFTRTLCQDLFHAGGGSHADSMLQTYGEAGARARRISPRHALLLALERRIFADPAQTIECVSGMVRRQIAARFGVPAERLPVLHCGVDAERFEPTSNAGAGRQLREELGASDSLVWLFAGSGWRRKGLDTAFAALAASERRDTQLWVAGADAAKPWRERAARLGLAERVRFLGARDDMEHLYAAADGLLFPTRYDGFGLVCLEAAASGIPVITCESAGASELMHEAGIVVKRAEDVAAFSAALDRLSEATLRETLGAAGLRLARQHTWASHAERLRALYGRLRK
jgi:UDP-glucose:(heptosyl)LPS alpha-1,3-glucosyltransferase